jgi:hypothetical protein
MEYSERQQTGHDMKSVKTGKIIASVFGILIALFLFFSSGLKIPFLDASADAYFREAITKGGISYATCRVINASVSIAKDSSLQLEPAGVGVSLAVGQALDPIDDLTERLSDVLITAITSLGVQKLAYEISVSIAPPILAVILFGLSILSFFGFERLKPFRNTILRFAMIIVIARFCLPVSSLANEFLNSRFFNDRISDANTQLSVGSAELDRLKDFSLPEIDGVMGTIGNSAAFLKRKALELNDALVSTVSNMGGLIENLLKLTFLYVSIFLIQVLVLPLLTFFFLIKTVNALFTVNIPVMPYTP